MFQFQCSNQITLNQTEEYKQELSIFAESFNMHGPGAVGDDLEKGKCTILMGFVFHILQPSIT